MCEPGTADALPWVMAVSKLDATTPVPSWNRLVLVLIAIAAIGLLLALCGTI